METSREIAIANAKLVLKQAGYFVDNLWHVDDVKLRYNCDDNDQAHYNKNQSQQHQHHITTTPTTTPQPNNKNTTTTTPQPENKK